MAYSTWPKLVRCLIVLLVTACGTVEDQAGQNRKSNANRGTDLLVKKQDAFIERATDLIREIDLLRQQPGWDDLAQTIRTARRSDAQNGGGSADQQRAPALAGLSRLGDLSGDEQHNQVRRLLERSATLEAERQDLVKEWSAASTQARLAIPAGRYNMKQLIAVLGNIELFYEMNRSVLKRYGLDELGLFATPTLPPVERPPSALISDDARRTQR